MAKQIVSQNRYAGGISYSEKEGPQTSYLFSKAVDYRTDPTKLKLNPQALKVSGNTVTDLIIDGDRQGTDTYLYGDSGNIYLRDTDESWSVLTNVAESQANGMRYFGEDSYLYYTSDNTIGRYGPFGGTKSFTDDFLGAEGGIPQNTHSLQLDGVADYATAADHSSLSPTGDISIEAEVRHNSLPDAGDSMAILGKWNESGNQRSYLFELYGSSNYFGDGTDGAVTVSTNDVYDSGFTEPLVDATCTATSGTYSISATNASFTANDKILVHQTQNGTAGTWERLEIQSYTAGTITTKTPLANSYVSGAQVLVLNEFTNFTVNTGITLTAKAWNGSTGGILAFLVSGTLTVTGNIVGTGKGFRGRTSRADVSKNNGEGINGYSVYDDSSRKNGGQGGSKDTPRSGGGGGGGNGAVGGNGQPSYSTHGTIYGLGGSVVGTSDLTTMVFGGGGGMGADGWTSYQQNGTGGHGGGIIMLSATTLTVTGTVISKGNNGGTGGGQDGGGGGGAGGSVLLKAQTGTLGTTLVTATAGAGGSGGGGNGGAGGVGRVHIDYLTSYTGTTNPTLNATQDNTLTGDATYQLRLGTSSTGTNEEYLAYTLSAPPQLDTWYRYQVAYDASLSTAYFYLNGELLGQNSGTFTSIFDSTALLSLGASFDGTGAAENFLDADIDDYRFFDDIRTANEFFINNEAVLASSTANLQAYYKLNNTEDDSSDNSNSLTLVSAPPYITDVAFSAATSRRDLDQSNDATGQTYTLATTIDEGDTHRQSFVPDKDPQKSIEVLIATVGTGDWTITVHDGLNREITSKTIDNTDLNSGDYEFVFDDIYRPVLGATYHFHLTSTVADGTVTSGTASDLEDCDFHTYYQFLVDDRNHPIHPVVNQLAIGNERYLATWDGVSWNPHTLALPSGYRIRCLGTWRGYLMIGCVLGDEIKAYDQGMIFVWDGIHTTYNDYIPIKEGGVNSIVSGDTMYFTAGYSADLMQYNGGTPQKIRRMPKVLSTDTLEINRNAMTMYKGLVRIGMAENCTSTDLERGVYSYGSFHKELPETLSFDYPLSLGITNGAELELGMLMPIGSKLLIGWRNGATYGADLVDPVNPPYTLGTIEFLITDTGKIEAEKQAAVLRAYFKALADGDTVKIKYKIDRADDWIEGITEKDSGYAAVEDEKEARLNIPTRNNRFNEAQFALDIGTTNTTSPEVYGIAMEFDDMNAENRV